MHDISLTYVGSYNMGGIFEIGAGLSMNRLIPFRPSETTPSSDESLILEVTAQTMAVSQPTDTIINIPAWEGPKKYWASDSVNRTLAAFGITNPDTIPIKTETKLTFKSTKVMVRASLDFKPVFGLEEDDGWKNGQFRLYGEVEINGVQNYPHYYKTMANRTAKMIGLSLPTWKILDYFSIELQHYPTKMPNNFQAIFEENHPAPYLTWMGDKSKWSPDSSYWNKNNIKWSVAAQRHVTEGFTIMAQLASDHLRPLDPSFHNCFGEVLWKPSAWYFDIRFLFGI